MKVNYVEYERLDLKLSEPYTIAYETVHKVTNFILKLHCDNGMIGYGCSAPDLVVTSESPKEIEEVINSIIIPLLTGSDPFTYAKLLGEMSFLMNSSALAMVDIALHDLISKKAGVPLYKYLGGFRDKIVTSVTIGILPLDESLKKASILLIEGLVS